MRVSLATFIIILFTIIAILFVKLRPTTIHYIPLEQYYEALKYCVGWMGTNTQNLENCLQDLTNSHLISIKSFIQITHKNFMELEEYDQELYNQIQSVFKMCGESFNENYLNITYINASIVVGFSSKVTFSYAAYLVIIRCRSSKNFVLLSDSIPLLLNISTVPETYCTYKYVVNVTEKLSYVNITCEEQVSKIVVTDERCLVVSWVSS